MAERTNAPACPVEERRVGRAAYGAGLENQLGRNPLAGSNPAPAALLRGREKPVGQKLPCGFSLFASDVTSEQQTAIPHSVGRVLHPPPSS